MTYKAKVAVCSEIRTKHSTQSEHRVELFNVKPGGKKKPLGFKRLKKEYNYTSIHPLGFHGLF
jgi:hypothetical protein